ncbi:hypothetical protein [Hymenobacter lapidiphilus]|uniref:hypothetical protein n=1 Tax=Hymenobacter sp. CCM 8763 TaxID=2303334 RepID=UPI0011C0F54D|nr:hypothetical protein [Hymenobacter sp. CCM 8763]
MNEFDLNKTLAELTKAMKPTYNSSASVCVRIKPAMLSDIDEVVEQTNCTRTKLIITAIEQYITIIKNNKI